MSIHPHLAYRVAVSRQEEMRSSQRRHAARVECRDDRWPFVAHSLEDLTVLDEGVTDDRELLRPRVPAGLLDLE